MLRFAPEGGVSTDPADSGGFSLCMSRGVVLGGSSSIHSHGKGLSRSVEVPVIVGTVWLD